MTLRSAGQTLVTSYKAFASDDGMLLSAGLAYYAFMSVFPLCLLSISILGYVWTAPRAVDLTLQFASDLLPPRGLTLVRDTIAAIATDRGRLGIIGLLTLLWLGRQLFEGIEVGLNRLWRVSGRRPPWRRSLVSMSLALLGGSLVLAEVLLAGFLSWAQTQTAALQLPPGLNQGVVLMWGGIHSWVITPATVFLMTLVLYRRLPRVPLSWKHCAPGAMFCTVVWKVASLVYFNYLSALTQSNPVYGSIWGVVGLLIWFFLCAVVFLFGAEIIRTVATSDTPQGDGSKL